MTTDRIGRTLHHLRRVTKERGTIYLFYIEDTFYFVTELPPSGNDKYICRDPNYVKKNKREYRTDGVLKCFEKVYEKYPHNYIGAYDENLCSKNVRQDIEEYFDHIGEDL